MSLILDALRKSEAERRRGQSPDFFASPPVAGAPRARPWPRALPVLLIVALALAAVFVLWPHSSETDSAHWEDALGRKRPMNADADASSAGGDLAPASVDVGPSIASAPASTRQSPRTPILGSAATASAQAEPRRLAAQAPESASAPAPTPLPTPTQASALAPAFTQAPASTPMPGTEDNPGEALPPIAVLAASERAALPPLKLSMHVWNSEPRKRFAIIDGQRTTEGSTVGTGVIEEIRRDGVVLNINGRRVLLPRP